MIGQRVFVYYNLHRGVWSVRALSGPARGRVIAHSDHVVLSQAHGRVSKAGRERVLREKRKNVHAGIVGTLQALDKPCGFFEAGLPVSYNPYKYENFVYQHNEQPFEGADWAVLSKRKVFVGSAATNPM